MLQPRIRLEVTTTPARAREAGKQGKQVVASASAASRALAIGGGLELRLDAPALIVVRLRPP